MKDCDPCYWWAGELIVLCIAGFAAGALYLGYSIDLLQGYLL